MVVPVLTLTACGQQNGDGQKVQGDSLAVFSSMPLDGSATAQAKRVVRGEKLAVELADAKVGKFSIKFGSLNNANGKGWDRRLTADNARKAVREGKTIAYVGQLESAASAISIPILNQEDVLEVSPTSTAVGLTKVFPGAKAGEPDRYFPSGKRNFVRLIATDDVMAGAAAKWSKDLKAKRVVVFNDGTDYGEGLAQQFRTAAEDIGVQVMDTPKIKLPAGSVYEAAATKSARADLVFYGGRQSRRSAKIFRAIHGKAPGALLISSSSEDGVLAREFYSNLGAAAGRTRMVSALLNTRQLSKSGGKFLRAYRKKFNQAPDSYSAYGYAAMEFVLDVLKRADDGANDRLRVVQEALDTKGFKSVLGKFSIDQNGDTSIRKIAGYRVSGGEPVFSEDLKG